MQLPLELKNIINEKINSIPLMELKNHSSALSKLYKEEKKEGVVPIASEYQRLAYISVRMPATYAAMMQVFRELYLRIPSIKIERVLDVGAGPGTGLWVFKEMFSNSLRHVTLLEQDPAFVRLGKELSSSLSDLSVEWKVANAVKTDSWEMHDLTVASFSLCELSEPEWKKILLSMWASTEKILVVIEPGTPKSFERIKKMRQVLLEEGAHLIAPCPHSQSCPLQDSDWCHFAARVERSSMHRQIKNATMNYEDEKFCYLIFSREPVPSYRFRILNRPEKNKGYVKFKLCSAQGIEQATISRKSKDEYRFARKAEWNDSF